MLFVIGRWIRLDTLNSVCHLSDHIWSWLRSVWRFSWSVLEEMLRYIILSSAKKAYRRFDVPIYVIYVE